jgi:N-acetylglucosaminyldiphosphoundecaprenol N-acetyl-beta-D-mannosaminyltransferase
MLTHQHLPRLTALQRVKVLGVGVHTTNLEEAVSLSDRLLQVGGRAYVCLTGVHGVMEAQRDPKLRRILNEAALCLPDGMPTVWVGRTQGFRNMARVYGPDYMLAMCSLSLARRYTHFLYGGKPGVAAILKQQLEQRFANIRITGTYTPPFGPLSCQQEAELLRRMAECRPDIVWVGLSTPKQEQFMAEYAPILNVGLMVGVGAAFDVHAGLITDSADWVKACGLQWLDRLRKEPRRLWRRYALNNPAFVWNLALQATGLRDFDSE